MKTVAICDSEPVAIEGLRSLLAAKTLEMRVVAGESLLEDGLDAAAELQPAVVILDKAFGMAPVLEGLETLAQSAPAARVIVWGAAISNPEALRLLHAGATGVARKTATLDALIDGIRSVAAGMTWMEEGLIPVAGLPVRGGRSPLTARELDVMDLVERGMTNRDIAAALGIRTGTVKIHLKHIFEKTGIRGRYGLALSGLQEKGILPARAFM